VLYQLTGELDSQVASNEAEISVGPNNHQLRFAGLSGGIWALTMLPNGQLVSGGGSGRLQFWDTRSGTLLQEFTEHKADVLTIAVSPDGDSVFAAGIDERIAMFRRTTSAEGDL